MFYTKPTDLNFSPDNFYKEPVAPSNPSSLSDIYSTAKTEEHTNQQLLSSHWNLADVYDEHNKKVKALTGADLINPTTLYSPSDGRDEERKRYYADFAKYKEEGGSLNQLGFLKNWREQDYRRQLEELAAKHPDKRGELLPERSFIDQSFGKRGETEKKAETTWEHSGKGMLDWGAWLSGKVAAGLTDPINVITAPVGFGAVGTGAKGLAMGFIKNGGVNAMVEVGQQPFIQGQRSDAGQSHGIGEGAMNVGGAFLFGGALDLGVRGTARALRYGLGYEPVTRDGVVVGYRRKTDAPAGGELAPVPEISPDLIQRAGNNDKAAIAEIERILSKDKSYIPAETVAKADEGDARAIRDVAERTGMADDPTMRHALDAMDANERIAEPPTKTINKGDHDAAITQGIRHAADPELEPVPVVRESVSPSTIHDLKGDILDLQAEIRRIGDELAVDPTTHPPTALADMRVKLAEVVEAHDAARRQVFADDVIEMVDTGKAPQDLADIVAAHVDDKTVQGKLLTDLIARKPESPLEARNQIAELLASPDYKRPPVDTAAPPVGLKTRQLDDPFGPDAKAQTDALEAAMAEELGRKTAPPPTPEEVAVKVKEVIDRGEQVRAAIAEVSGIVPAGVEVRVFSSIADLPDALRGRVEMANAKAFAVAMQRFQSATSDVAREAARRMKDDAKNLRGIEGIAQDHTIWIASFAMDPKGRVAHEVVHALRTMGQIAPDEVRILAEHARESGAFSESTSRLYNFELMSRELKAIGVSDPRIEELYKAGFKPEEIRAEFEKRGQSYDKAEAKVSDILTEEAAAHAIEGAARRTDTPTPIKSITDRIYEFIERVGNALRRQGFMTAEEKATLAAKPANDVIQSFMSGEMMKREGVKAWMRQEDITAIAQRDAVPEPTYRDPQSGIDVPQEDIDSIINMWRYVQETNAKRKPQTLSQWIIETGRVRDQNSELTNILGGKARHLISGKGRNLDDAAEAAWEAGFFSGDRPSVRQFLEAIDDDVRGNSRIRSIDEALADDIAVARDMMNDLDQMGLGNVRTEADIYRYFGASGGGEGARSSQANPRRTSRGTAEKVDDVPFYAMADNAEQKVKAEAAGFDTSHVLYHGTGNAIDAFSLRKAQDKEGRERGLGLGRGKIYLTGNQWSAGQWALMAPERGLGKQPNVMPVYVKGPLLDEPAYHAKFKEISGGREILDSTLSMKERDALIEQTDDWAKAEGFAGVRQAYRDHKSGSIMEVGQVAIFDPKNIRSVNAEFDPAKADSPNLMFAFAGERAKTADLEALSRAKEMTASGLDRAKVWHDTGWFQGVDGKWRFEIDDSGAKLKFDADGPLGFDDLLLGSGNEGIPLRDFIHHPEAFAAHGRFEDVNVVPEMERGIAGTWGNDLDEISVNPYQSAREMRKTALHEIQHGMQFYGGMAEGDASRAGADTYRRSAGEVEARTVEKRMDLTAEQRRARPPWLDYDVPESQQIVRGMSEPMFAMVDRNVGQDMKRDLDRLGYFSGALEAAKKIKQAKGTPEQMLSQLRAGGAKAGEIEATGLSKFLEGRPSVTRDEIVMHLEDNRLGLNEVKYGGGALEWGNQPSARGTIAERLSSMFGDDGQNYRRGSRSIDQIAEQFGGRAQRMEDGTSVVTFRDGSRFIDADGYGWDVAGGGRTVDAVAPSKWSAHSLDPSNPTYRETVLHLPRTPYGDADIARIVDEQFKPGTKFDDLNDAAQEAVRRRAADLASYNDFGSGHFPEPNIVGHMMTSMTKHEGKPVYTIDQIQSDWGQKLRDGGVRDEKKIAGLKDQLATIEKDLGPLADIRNWQGAAEGDLTRMSQRLSLPRERAQYPEAARLVADVVGTEREAAVVEQIQKARMLDAEISTANASSPGHPLVNTTDQWTNTTLRRAIRQAAEADAEFIAIPSGDTVLSYNPGDTAGMHGFYGSATQEGIVPKNLRKLLDKIDSTIKPIKADKLETPTSGMKGKGFTLFPLTEKVKTAVKEEGLPLFAMKSEPEIRSAMQEQAKRGTELPDGTKVNGIHLFAIKAYHGSPHDFDKFDASKIGTGEGAQAYGHGLYFAENEGVAKSYREALRDLKIDGKPPNWDDPAHWIATALHDAKGNPAEAVKALERYQMEANIADRPVLEKARQAVGQGNFPPNLPKVADGGRMYEVNINADPEHFLDWDKPLSQQSEKVREALAPRLAQEQNIMAARSKMDDQLAQMGGWGNSAKNAIDEHHLVQDAVRDPEWSAKLKDAGIPGVKYLDQGSRGAGEGTYNYVVFDDKLIEIKAKDGKPVGNDPQFAMRDERQDLTPERIAHLVQPYLDAYPNITKMVQEGIASTDLPSIVSRLAENGEAIKEARTALSSVVGDEAAQNIELAVLRALVTGESPVDLQALSGIAKQVMDQIAPQPPRASEPMFAMRDEEGRMKLGARERAQQLQDDLAAIEAQFQIAGGDERLKLQAKRAALLSAQAFEKVIDDTGLYRDGLGRGDRARALMALIETHGENEMVPFADLVSSKKNIENHALGMVEGMLWDWRKGAVSGDLRRKFNSSVKANMENVIREASGVSTNDATAKVFAKSWLEATEYLRQRFNAAGGDIGKLAGWFMPQFHDADALVKVGREAWVNRLMADGVLAREKIIDYETNAPMTDAKLRPMLREIWLAITSDGASRMEIGDAPAGKGALYKRHMEHRVLHFKDADQWIKYNRDFGGGDIYSAMIGHVNMMARDIALMERFGPNPERTMQRVKATILNEAKMQQPAKSMFDDFKEQVDALKASLKTLPSEVDGITAAIGEVHAKIDAIRVENPGKRARRRAEGKIEELRQQLGPLHQRLDKAVETNNPTPQQRVMIDKIQAAAEEMAFAEQYLVTSRNPTERTNRILSRADEMMKVYNGTTNTPIDSKFAGAMVGIRNIISASSLVFAPFSAVTDQATQLAARLFVGMPTTSILSSFVKGFTQGDRRLALEVGLGLDQVAAAFAQQARFVGGYNARHITGYITDRSHAYSLLSPMTQASKVGFGLDFMRWMAGMKDTAFKDLGEETTRMMAKHGFTANDWAAIKAAQPEKGLLTRNAVAQAAGDDVAEKYMRMLYRERGQAVLEGTIQGRTAFISDTQPGTVTGELLRSAAMLKSFPTSYMMLILGRLYNEGMAGRGLKASTIGYGASIFIVGTMLGAVAKQLKNVGQGRDPEDMTKAKFWAESFMQSGGAGIFGDFIGSSVNRMGSGLAGTIMGPVADRGGTLLDLTFGNVAQYAKDEKTNAGREFTKVLRQNTPGMFAPWYIRLAYERLLLDEVQKKVDPEYYKSFESKVRAQKKRSGNDFFFPPGGTYRAPNMGAAFGQQ